MSQYDLELMRTMHDARSRRLRRNRGALERWRPEAAPSRRRKWRR